MPENPCEICYENEHELEVYVKMTYNGVETCSHKYICLGCLGDLKNKDLIFGE